MRRVLVMAAVLLSVGVVAQEQAPADLSKALAQQTDALGQCNAERGQLQRLQASVIGGQLVEPTKLQAEIKAKFEAANPGKTWDDAMKVTDKAAGKK